MGYSISQNKQTNNVPLITEQFQRLWFEESEKISTWLGLTSLIYWMESESWDPRVWEDCGWSEDKSLVLIWKDTEWIFIPLRCFYERDELTIRGGGGGGGWCLKIKSVPGVCLTEVSHVPHNCSWNKLTKYKWNSADRWSFLHSSKSCLRGMRTQHKRKKRLMMVKHNMYSIIQGNDNDTQGQCKKFTPIKCSISPSKMTSWGNISHTKSKRRTTYLQISPTQI